MTKKILEELKLKLKQAKQSLENQLRSFAKKDPNLKHDWDTKFPKFDGGHLEEAADEVEEYSSLLPVEFSLETKLKDINLALEKIKKKKYGVCEKCGKIISQKRLNVSPEAKFCLKCMPH
jgi:DnaK suppressor protein